MLRPASVTVERGVVQCGLPGRNAERRHASLELRHALFEDVGGRVGDARVAVSVDFEIEQGGAVLGAVEGVRHRLIDRDRDRLGGRVAVEAAVNGDRFALHARFIPDPSRLRFAAPEYPRHACSARRPC